VTVHADSVDTKQANNQDSNGVPIVVSSISSTPFDGQFLQFDVVSVTTP
jgi:hypothetical protein